MSIKKDFMTLKDFAKFVSKSEIWVRKKLLEEKPDLPPRYRIGSTTYFKISETIKWVNKSMEK